MLYPSDLTMVTIMLNIYEHMKKDYDYLLIVCGDTGTGKSRFVLNLFETWYRVILKRKVTEEMISQISQNYSGWLREFKNIGEFDMNVFDESSRNLNSLNFMSRISKDINKLFDVCRCKKFFSVVILPKYFRLNKALREDRLRGLIWVNKRGNYKFYTKHDLVYLNGINENRKIKSMFVSRPFHQTRCPDYKGVLLEPYLKQKEEGVDEVIDEVIGNIPEEKEKRPLTLVEKYKDKVKELKDMGYKRDQIAKDLYISTGSVSKCLRALTND